eukprot:102377-Chlamydomonas_euryale.AAC.1
MVRLRTRVLGHRDRGAPRQRRLRRPAERRRCHLGRPAWRHRRRQRCRRCQGTRRCSRRKVR